MLKKNYSPNTTVLVIGGTGDTNKIVIIDNNHTDDNVLGIAVSVHSSLDLYTCYCLFAQHLRFFVSLKLLGYFLTSVVAMMLSHFSHQTLRSCYCHNARHIRLFVRIGLVCTRFLCVSFL